MTCGDDDIAAFVLRIDCGAIGKMKRMRRLTEVFAIAIKYLRRSNPSRFSRT
jgi:hypothetical protein